MFELKRVSLSIQGQPVLRDISWDLPAGRTTAVIGPSGSGKSTLLRVLLGLVAATEGEVIWRGAETKPEEIRRQIGYVVQDGGLFPHLNAERNVTLVARYLGWEAPRLQARLGELCALARFDRHLLARYPNELSGGQRQRVGLMRALMLDPPVLFFDEPLSALDPITRRELQQELGELFRRLGKTVVFVTHDLNEAAYLADDLLLLREGRIEQRGGLPDLLERPQSEFVTLFVRAQRSPLFAQAARRASGKAR